MASCHSFVMVLGGGRAKEWRARKIAAEAARPMVVYKMIFVHSPGGDSARGPCGPNAIHQAIMITASVPSIEVAS